MFAHLHKVPTGSPKIISAEAIDPTTVHLSWNPPKSYDRNGIIVYYIINITSFNLPTTESFSQHCTTLSCNISNLHLTSSLCWLLPLVQVHIVKPTHLQHLKLVSVYKLYFYSIAK